MSLLNENERTVTYAHDHELPYWIIAAPPGTPADTVTASLPLHSVTMIADCLKTGKTIFAVLDEKQWVCTQSETSFPQILTLMTVAKQTGESTTFLIRRTANGMELTSMK